eukprot:3162532-Amphidinium_carterae.1
MGCGSFSASWSGTLHFFSGRMLALERKISGNGPAEGWISVKLKDKDLAIKMPVAEADPAAPAAEEVGALLWNRSVALEAYLLFTSRKS